MIKLEFRQKGKPLGAVEGKNYTETMWAGALLAKELGYKYDLATHKFISKKDGVLKILTREITGEA